MSSLASDFLENLNEKKLWDLNERLVEAQGYSHGLMCVVKSGVDEVLQSFSEIWLNYGIYMSGEINVENDK